jgi:hypothetical protein
VKASVPELGQDPPLHDLDSGFDLGFVAGLSGTRRQNRGAIVGGQVGIGAVDRRLEPAGLADRALQVVGHDRLGHPADEGQGPNVAADPIGQLLAPGRLGVGEVGSAEHGDEDLGLPNLTGRQVDYLDGLAGVVDEQLVAGDVVLSHHRGQPPPPELIELAESAQPVAVGLLDPVFLPQQAQGHARPLQLGMDPRPIRLCTVALAWRRRKEPALQLGVVQFVGQGPAHAAISGAMNVVGHGGVADAERATDRPIAQPAAMFEAQNLSNLAHRRSLRWHGAPRIVRYEERPYRRLLCASGSPHPDQPGPVPTFIGIDAQLKSDSLPSFDRIHCPLWSGLRTPLGAE